ncbi:MAG: transketolase, partial [Candidatus Gastranaerophilales bacterium]|nr:transketolase [Candidatus Gastranaerophilales bacterium]
SILKMIFNAQSGHLGGNLSAVELILTLYKKVLKHDKKWKNSKDFKNRDRFVLSKGHASAALYCVLAEEGYFDKTELMTFRKFGSKLQGHPSSRMLDGIDISTGSLGQGLSIACGMALGLKLDKIDSFVYAYLGDGEIQEGQIYEAMMNAGHNRLNNLIAIVDRNSYQIDGHTECVKAVSPIDKKFQSFGWETLEVDGHNIERILEVYEKAKEIAVSHKKPVAIIANTVKGKGVSFMENTSAWHGKAPNKEQFEAALKELEE